MGLFNESAANLLPVKFLLLIIQILLLVVVLLTKENHLWFPLGTVQFTANSTQYKQANAELIAVSAVWIAICAFEFLMMICGSTIPAFLMQLNLLQIMIHFMGVMFTTWFLLDSWRYNTLWALWGVFSIPIFLMELFAIQQSLKLKSDIKKNAKG